MSALNQLEGHSGSAVEQPPHRKGETRVPEAQKGRHTGPSRVAEGRTTTHGSAISKGSSRPILDKK